MDDLSRFCCLNSGCPEHGKRGAGNLSVTSRYGPEKARRMLRCRVCKARFSERKGTPLFDSRLPPMKVESVLEHIAEGCGVRQTGRLCQVNPGTVGRLSRIAGAHARDLHDELVSLPPLTREIQFDEKWAFVAKKEKNCDPADPADDRKGTPDMRNRCREPVGRQRRTRRADGRECRGGGRGRQASHHGPADGPDHDRRVSGLRGGDLGRLWGDDHSAPDGPARRPKAPYTVAPKGLTYAVVEKTREGPSGVDRHAGGLRHDGGRGGGVGDIARQHGNQYVVRGASERDGPAPQRPEVAQDVPVQ